MSDLLVKHATMAGLGPLDPSELPWPRPLMPLFAQTSRVGKYRMQRLQVGMVSGYFRGTHPAKDPIWSLTCRDRSVDKVDEMGLESYAPHIQVASGHVLLLGFGMGVMVHNLLLKSDVTRITILDPRKTEVQFLIKNTGMLASKAGMDKVTGLYLGETAHTVTTKDIGPVDHMFVEGHIGSVETMRTVAKTVKQTKPGNVSWKGMEIDYVDWLHSAFTEHGRPVPVTADDARDAGNLRDWNIAAQKYGVNLSAILTLHDWGYWAHRAVKNVTVY